MVFDTALLSTQNYKARIKSKVDPGNEVTPSPSVVAIENGAFRSLSFTYYLLKTHTDSLLILEKYFKFLK